MTVQDLVATTPEAEAALWQYLCGIDLVTWISHWNVAPDTELPWRLVDSRQVRTRSFRDWLWLRPIDTPAFLAARRYATDGRLVLEVRDEMRPDGGAAGRFVLAGGPDEASCHPTDAAPELRRRRRDARLDHARWDHRINARPGRPDRGADVPGALGRADRMFAADRAPFSLTWF